MSPSRILFVDDDAEMRVMVQSILSQDGFEVQCVETGGEAVEIVRCRPPLNLVILDVMMPGMDGLETCQKIRKISDIPVILLTARGDEQAVLEGFSAGAYDVVTKPFRPKELIARVKSIMERFPCTPFDKDNKVQYRDLMLNLAAREVYRGEQPVALSRTSFQLLHYFVLHPKQVISKEDLLKSVWLYADTTGDLNLVEAAIKRLRREIDDDPDHPQYIFTVRGSGYRLGG